MSFGYLRHEDNRRAFGVLVKFGGSCVRNIHLVSSPFDNCELEAKANSEVRLVVFASMLYGEEHTFDSAITKPSGHEDPSEKESKSFSLKMFQEQLTQHLRPLAMHRDTLKDVLFAPPAPNLRIRPTMTKNFSKAIWRKETIMLPEH